MNDAIKAATGATAIADAVDRGTVCSAAARYSYAWSASSDSAETDNTFLRAFHQGDYGLLHQLEAVSEDAYAIAQAQIECSGLVSGRGPGTGPFGLSLSYTGSSQDLAALIAEHYCPHWVDETSLPDVHSDMPSLAVAPRVPSAPLPNTAQTAPTASTASDTPTLERTPTAAPPGYGAVKIGMSRDALLASGDVTGSQPSSDCSGYTLAAGGTAVYSERLGRVVAIDFAEQMPTSKGIHIGSSQEDLLKAYPGADVDFNGYLTPRISETVHYEIGYSDDRVAEIILTADDQNCFG